MIIKDGLILYLLLVCQFSREYIEAIQSWHSRKKEKTHVTNPHLFFVHKNHFLRIEHQACTSIDQKYVLTCKWFTGSLFWLIMHHRRVGAHWGNGVKAITSGDVTTWDGHVQDPRDLLTTKTYSKSDKSIIITEKTNTGKICLHSVLTWRCNHMECPII